MPQPSALGLLHGSRDVTAVLHQLEPVILDDPPRDGRLAGPQAAVKDVVAAAHWRRNTACRLSPAEPLPEESQGCGRTVPAGMLSHTALPGHTGTIVEGFIALASQCCEPFASSPRKSKEMGKSKQAEGNPPAPKLARKDTGVFIYPASGCCNTDKHFQGVGDDFRFIY